MTPEAAILVALNARAQTATTRPLVYREIPGERPDEYVLVDFLPNQSERPMLDNARQDLMGIYQMTLVRKAGEYETVYREEAALIADAFRAGAKPEADGRKVTIQKTDLEQGRPDDAGWAVPISIYYRLDA